MGQSMPMGTKTILIVEDEALVRFDLVAFFEDAGWRVFEAEGADEAMAILDERRDVRVVLTDVQMPGSMDGVRLAHHVRERFPPTILFVVSGARSIPAEELPAHSTFVAKPFDPNRVLRQIEAGLA